jgi:hypothetical protein
VIGAFSLFLLPFGRPGPRLTGMREEAPRACGSGAAVVLGPLPGYDRAADLLLTLT